MHQYIATLATRIDELAGASNYQLKRFIGVLQVETEVLEFTAMMIRKFQGAVNNVRDAEATQRGQVGCIRVCSDP